MSLFVPEETLDFVTQTAKEAGVLIRAEFERPDGPRGPLGRCPVDTAAEILIRDRFRSRYPDWSFFGEETGLTGEPSEYHWLVDPQDGTTAFQRGYRGSTVSIALLRGKELVLGVVYAPCPPVGHEDLITWVEGKPVARNGKAIQRDWPAALDRYEAVLLSQYADHRPTLTGELVAPARFIGVPSVAYRLALTAVGEGAATVSLANSSDYDFAAGHAILRGMGGSVLDGEGNEPIYAPFGGRQIDSRGLLVGGAPAVTKELVSKPWSTVRTADREDVPYVFLSPGKVQLEADLRNRAQGLMLGQLIGDALGAQVEFKTAQTIRELHPEGVRKIRDGGPFDTLAGQPTDDSEMAMSLARTLLAGGREFDIQHIAEAYVRWYRSEPVDIGKTTRIACSAGDIALKQGGDVVDAMRKGANVESQSNGALMRISPLAIWAHNYPEQGMKFAAEDAKLTHPHPVCQVSNMAFVAALVAGLKGQSPEQMLAKAVQVAQRSEYGAPVLERLERAHSEVPVLDDAKMGWVLHAIQNAFYELLHAHSFEEALVRTVGRGGDTDTNGAITGALLGARFGAQDLPLAWRQMVLSCRAISAPGRRRARTWEATDALRIAECLSLSATPRRVTT